MSKYAVGTILCTNNSQAHTNAIIINETGNGHFIVLSDFGNIMTVPVEMIQSYYDVSNNYLEYKALDYPFPTVEERIKEQIVLLNTALVAVKQLNQLTDIK